MYLSNGKNIVNIIIHTPLLHKQWILKQMITKIIKQLSGNTGGYNFDTYRVRIQPLEVSKD